MKSGRLSRLRLASASRIVWQTSGFRLLKESVKVGVLLNRIEDTLAHLDPLAMPGVFRQHLVVDPPGQAEIHEPERRSGHRHEAEAIEQVGSGGRFPESCAMVIDQVRV